MASALTTQPVRCGADEDVPLRSHTRHNLLELAPSVDFFSPHRIPDISGVSVCVLEAGCLTDFHQEEKPPLSRWLRGCRLAAAQPLLLPEQGCW